MLYLGFMYCWHGIFFHALRFNLGFTRGFLHDSRFSSLFIFHMVVCCHSFFLLVRLYRKIKLLVFTIWSFRWPQYSLIVSTLCESPAYHSRFKIKRHRVVCILFHHNHFSRKEYNPVRPTAMIPTASATVRTRIRKASDSANQHQVVKHLRTDDQSGSSETQFFYYM